MEGEGAPMNFSLADSLADCPIIAAAKNDEGLEQALSLSLIHI